MNQLLSYVFTIFFPVECPIGTYYHNDNCEACAEGMFQDQTGQTSCKSCPSGTSSFKGSWNCKRELCVLTN